MPIKLLVSVRDAKEAVFAVEGGADIVDVKEPEAGPLGFAGAQTVQSVIEAIAGRAPVSAALGECTDWMDSTPTASGQSPTGGALEFVKVGLAGLATQSDVWIDQWLSARAASLVGLPVGESTGWVAVAYSDAERANAPSPMQVLEAAEQHDCRVFLLDTFVKDGKTTLDWLTEPELIALRERANASGMQFAIAGQLTAEHLDIVHTIRPDILAVRGAVCDQRERQRSISVARVAGLKQLLR